MPTRRLIQLDDDTWGWSEIDMVKLKRVATEFKNWLNTVDPDNDPFGFVKQDVPLVDAALDGTMRLPFKGRHPHNWEIREGLLPEPYNDYSGPFYNTIRGAHLTPPEVIERDGKRFAWAEFEDLPDAADGVT
jgi:hypothetical protein